MKDLLMEELDIIDAMTQHFSNMKFACDNTVFSHINEAQAELMESIMDLYIQKRNYYRSLKT